MDIGKFSPWSLLAEGIRDTVNLGNQWITNKWNYDKSIEMWRRQNEYNSPVNQMERLKQAGLNPALVYGNGATALSTQAPRYTPMEVQQLGEGIGYMAFQELANMRAQRDYVNAQRGYVNAQMRNANIDSSIKFEELKARRRENKILEANPGLSSSDSPLVKAVYRGGNRILGYYSENNIPSPVGFLERVGGRVYDFVSLPKKLSYSYDGVKAIYKDMWSKIRKKVR